MRRAPFVLLLVLSCLIGGAAPGSALEPRDVYVEDTAGVLDRDALLAALDQTEFRDSTTVLVYTYNSLPGVDPNAAFLQFVETAHPQWISADGRTWADGLFVFVVDAESGLSGTYFGKDRILSVQQKDEVREEAEELFAKGRWTEGTANAVDKAADLINRPWYATDAAVGAAGAGLLAGFLWLRAHFSRRRNRRNKNSVLLQEADAAYASVSLDLDVTELNARTIPADSRYGSRVLELHRTFMTRYATATERNRAAANLRDLGSPGSTAVVTAYAETALQLDRLDDVIADTNALLTMSPGWERAWDRQAAPLAAELDALTELAARDPKLSGSGSTAALLGFQAAARQELISWGAALADGTLAPDDALDYLRDARTKLADLLTLHSEAAIDAYAETDAERRLMRDAMDSACRLPGEDGQRPGIVDAAFPTPRYSVATLDNRLQAATTKIGAGSSRRPAAAAGAAR